MKIRINRNSPISLYLQIYNQVKALIYSKHLPYKHMLPSERNLSESLDVDRSTVVKAYDKLKAEGLIKSHIGKGTFVIFTLEDTSKKKVLINRFDWNSCFGENNKMKYDDIIHLIMNANSNDDRIFFAGGLPSLDLFPVEAFNHIKQESLNICLAELFTHSPVLGIRDLRYQIKNMMIKYGIKSNINEIMITSGSQQGLDLVIRSFVSKGDVVLVEEPSFFGAIQLFQHIGAKIVSVPMDQDGMDMEILEFLMKKHQPKLIYTIPNFHNPTGITMGLERRYKLVELSNYYKIPIIEDDPYVMIRYEGKNLPSLKSLDFSNHVIYLSTFSKTISLGLRIGWICAPEEVINRLKKIKQITDLHVNTINQYFLSELIQSNLYEKHLEHINKIYAQKRDLMIDRLRSNFKNIEFSEPDGGFYIWVHFTEEVDMKLFFDIAYQNGVVFTPGQYFLVKGRKNNQYIRLNFTFPNVEQIDEGMKLLSICYYEAIKNGGN